MARSNARSRENLAGKALSMVHRLLHMFPWLYLVWAFPFGLAVIWVTPPWQNPDEPSHFLRSEQIAKGGWLGHRNSSARNDIGGQSDPAIMATVKLFDGIPHHSEVKDNQTRETAARSIHWSTVTENGWFPNTAVYPPVFYLPSALAILCGKAGSLSIVTSLFTVRAANLLISVVLTAAGLWAANRTRIALMTIAILPMNVALMASAAQDGPMLAAIILVVGMIDRLNAPARSIKLWELVVITVALAGAGMARPPHLFLLCLLPMTSPSCRRPVWIAMFAGFAAIAAWIALAAPITPSFEPANPSAQVSFLLHHPGAVFSIAVETLRNRSADYIKMFVGVLGWLDTDLPGWLVNLTKIGLFLSFAATLSGPTFRHPWLAWVTVAMSAATIFGIEYVTWTAPGNAIVEGVQGRYFIPLASVLALALPGASKLGRLIEPWAAGLLAILMVAIPPVVIHGLVLRYYLAG